MASKTERSCLASVFLLSLVSTCLAEIQVTDLRNVIVQGAWMNSSDGNFERTSDRQRFDLNQDGVRDLELQHAYDATTVGGVPISVDGVINVAAPILNEIGDELSKIRQLVIRAANSGVNAQDELAQIQSEISDRQDAIFWLSRKATWNDRRLLDGSFGVWGTFPNGIGRVVSTGIQSRGGAFHVQVAEPAARAWAATAPDLPPLRQNETLTINGVSIELSAGSDLEQRAARINAFRARTGVSARILASNELVLIGSQFGENEEFTVASDAHPSVPGSTGLNTHAVGNAATLMSSSGAYASQHGYVHRSDGVVVELSSGPDPRFTQHGTLSATMEDGSLVFPLGVNREDSFVVTLPNLDLGQRSFASVEGKYLNLVQVSAFDGSDALQEAIGAIDSAQREVDQVFATLEWFRKESELPAGAAEALPLNHTRLVGDASSVWEVEPGDWVDANSDWSSRGLLQVAGTDFDSWDIGSRFFGVELLIDERRHFGWLEVALTADSGVLLKRSAFESLPGVGIQVASVPEPATPMGLAVAVLLTLLWRKHRQ